MTIYEQWYGHPISQASDEELKKVFFEIDSCSLAGRWCLIQVSREMTKRNLFETLDTK
jgi:hypothetical protein